MRNIRHQLLILFAAIAAMIAAPHDAIAITYGDISVSGCKIIYTTSCDPAPFMTVEPKDLPGVIAGELSSGTAGPGVKLIARIFSSIVCQVETIIGETMGDLWCGISEQMAEPLAALLVLYVVIFAVSFTLGLTHLSAGEVGTRMVKIMLVWVFATQSQYALGIMFQFYMWLIKDGIAIVMTSVSNSTFSSDEILHKLDLMVSTIFYTNDFAGGGRVATFITGAITLAAMPGGAFLGSAIMAMAFMTMFVFVRTILTYLMAIIIVVFYLSMGPIFLCCALFKASQQTFHNWLNSLAGFALQPVLIFAYLIMIEAYMPDFNEKIWPFVRSIIDQNGSQPSDFCDGPSCMIAYINTVKVDPACIDKPGAPCQTYNLNWDFSQGYGDWTIFLKNIGITFILSYTTITFLSMVPSLARLLASGGSRALMLGGGFSNRQTSFDGSVLNARGFDNLFSLSAAGSKTAGSPNPNDSIIAQAIERVGPGLISGNMDDKTLSTLLSDIGNNIAQEFKPQDTKFTSLGTPTH